MKVSKLPFLLLPLLLLLASCSRDPKSLVATGNKYFDRAKYKEASIMYRKALQKDRKFGDAWYRLGLVDAKLGAWGEALSSYQRAVELDPANSDAAANLADLYLASYLFSSTHPKESLAETKELAKGLLKRDPNSFDGLRLAGYVALMENNTAEAQKDFETANRSRPWQPAVVLTLCEIYSAGEHAPEAESLAREMISHQKQDGEIYDFLVRYYLIHKRVGDAEAVLVEKIANNPKVGPYVIELARFYQATGRRDAVEATLARLTSNANSYPDGWMLVGSYYLTNGDADAALQAFTKGESVDAKNKTAYQKRRVETLVVKGRTDEASSLAGEILKANPDDPEAIALSAIIGIQTGKPDQLQRAIDDLGPLIGKYPSVPATPMLRYHLARAYVAKANLDAGDADPTRKLKELDQARNQLEQAFQGGRFTFTPARLLLAQVDMEGREYARVTQLADDVLRTEPGNLRARLMRTDALARMGEYDKAEAELDQVLAINPNIEDAQLQLARVYIAEKKFAQAEAILEKGQSTDPRAFMELVDLKVAEGKTADAIQMLSRQSAANPNSLMLRFALANVEMNARKYDEAIGVFRQMLDRGSGLTASGKAQVYSRIGTAQEGKGDYQRRGGQLHGGKQAYA